MSFPATYVGAAHVDEVDTVLLSWETMGISIRKGMDPSGSDSCVSSPNPTGEAKGKLQNNTYRMMPLGTRQTK